MIVADTSVWVEALRDGEGNTARDLRHHLDADKIAVAVPVRLELLGGASRDDHPRLARLLSALPIYYPDRSTWALIEQWVALGLDKGERFAVIDLLIGAIAQEHDAAVWSQDADFVRMQTLGLIETHG